MLSDHARRTAETMHGTYDGHVTRLLYVRYGFWEETSSTRNTDHVTRRLAHRMRHAQ
jgi:hypothetical protein